MTGRSWTSPATTTRRAFCTCPTPSLSVPPVSDRPTSLEVQRAGRMLLDVVADFPFVTVHDRANYLGALLTPLLRPLVPPPYKLVAIGAPQRGSGKSLLASILRELHGGVFKSEFPPATTSCGSTSPRRSTRPPARWCSSTTSPGC